MPEMSEAAFLLSEPAPEDTATHADRWGNIHRLAVERFGAGAQRLSRPDFTVRLQLIRDALGMTATIWPDNCIAHIMYGGDQGKAAIALSKIKKTTSKLDEASAAMLAGLVNHILAGEPLRNSAVSLEQRAEVVLWIENAPARQSEEFEARDLHGDILVMAAKLHRVVEASGFGLQGPAYDAAVHEQMMRHLTSPADHASRSQRLEIQRRRRGPVIPGRRRFGAELAPSGNPREWSPLEFEPGAIIEYGLSIRAAAPLKGWLVTVRDGMKGVGAQAETVWSAGWDNTLRWFASPFPLSPGTEIAAPTTEANVVIPMPGLFHVFLLTEPAPSKALSSVLGDRPGELSGPDAAAYLKLLHDLPGLGDLGVNIYASSYRVRAGDRAGASGLTSN